MVLIDLRILKTMIRLILTIQVCDENGIDGERNHELEEEL